MFKYRGVFVIATDKITEEQIIESGCDDYMIDGDNTRLICLREQFSDVTNFLKNAHIEVSSSGFDYLPNMEIEITDFEQGVKVMKLLQDLDADDDVEKVWTNGVFDDILREKIESFLDSHGFRS
ncbi:YebC/PmpR family DNA-binding transcriptional regulator [Candidatus Peribacteria bacterium]|nr:YebC/PmpR family DNA-binding transcriptional regulator [Candidatus Peribacteria bacterium]